MTKPTPLQALQNLTEYLTGDYRDCFEELSIIETALKREDSIEITAIDIEQENQALCKENKKLKQILEIIKDMFEIWEDNGTYHIRPLFDIARLAKEEYDLLKEVLL